MSEVDFNKHIDNLQKINDIQDKLNYLEKVIETIDYDCNGYNDQLVELRNNLNNQLKNQKK